jgi:hypothetical protein
LIIKTKAGIARTITGESAILNNTTEKTVQDINALFLWNNSLRHINFIDDNSIVFNAIFILLKIADNLHGCY